MKIRDVTLNETDSSAVETYLKTIVAEGKAAAALLLGTDGFVVSRAGSNTLPDPIGFSTLIAASFGAARETARMAGVKALDSMYWQESGFGIYVIRIGEDHLLVNMHDESATFGLLKLVAERTGEAMKVLLEKRATEIEAGMDPQQGKWKDIVEQIRTDNPMDEIESALSTDNDEPVEPTNPS